MPAPKLLTYYDVIAHLMNWASAKDRGTASREMMRRATVDAYEEITNYHDWSYLQQPHRIRLVAGDTDGTATYDHCVTPEHEALTRGGWKTLDQLEVGEEILAYDHDAEMTRWEKVEEVHQFDYSGDVLNVQRKGRTVLRCTPNHRIPVYKRRRAGPDEKAFVKASDLTAEMATPLSAPLDKETGGPLTPRLAAILAWVVTDGTGLFEKWRSGVIMQSHVVNAEKCEEITSLVGKPPRLCASQPKMSRWTISKFDRGFIRGTCGCKGDLLPLVTRLGVQENEAVVRAMNLAEASTNPNGQKVFTQWGDNKPVADAFQVACILSGRATNMCVRTYDGKERYQCTVRTRNRIKLAKQSEWEHYSGKVYCPQVPSSAWVVRCNGAVMVTGNSGGSSERLLTIASTTFNTDWAQDGCVQIGDDIHHIDTVIDTTNATLDPIMNPGADVAAGTACTIFPYWYILPSDFVRFTGPLKDGNWTELSPVAGKEMLMMHSQGRAPSNVTYYWVSGAPDLHGSYVLNIVPASATAEPLDFIYTRRPRALRYTGFDAADYAGTVAATDGSAVWTGTSTTFTEEMEGSIIRRASDGNRPSSHAGEKPFKEERSIITYTSATSITVDAAADETVSAKGYVVTDPIDLPKGIHAAFLRCCEKHLAIVLNRDKRDAIALADREMSDAKAADSHTRQRRVAGTYSSQPVSRLRDAPYTALD